MLIPCTVINRFIRSLTGSDLVRSLVADRTIPEAVRLWKYDQGILLVLRTQSLLS